MSKVAFLFPGQGAQYVEMGAELYRVEPTFREWIDRCQALLPEREWRIWSEVELRGLSAAEVARSLDISESAARGVLFRARERILHTLCGDDE